MPKPHAIVSHEDLKNRLLELIQRPDKDAVGGWLERWRLLVEHPWYQEQLDLCARQELRRSRISGDWLEDVKQDAMLLLAGKLRRTPDLNLDPQRADEHFAGWLGTIIRHHCREALRKLRRQRRDSQELLGDESSRETGMSLDDKIDLSLTLDQLADPQRTVMILATKNWTLQEIAAALGFSYWKTRRIYLTGLEQLGRRLVR